MNLPGTVKRSNKLPTTCPYTLHAFLAPQGLKPQTSNALASLVAILRQLAASPSRTNHQKKKSIAKESLAFVHDLKRLMLATSLTRIVCRNGYDVDTKRVCFQRIALQEWVAWVEEGTTLAPF